MGGKEHNWELIAATGNEASMMLKEDVLEHSQVEIEKLMKPSWKGPLPCNTVRHLAVHVAVHVRYDSSTTRTR
jgi:hypothetical protein